MRVLALNSGSSSLKWTLLAADGTAVAGASESWTGSDLGAKVIQIRAALAAVPPFDVAGHRVVHGGTRFRGPVTVDSAVRDELRQLIHLSPEHMLPGLAGLDAVQALHPNTPQIAVFDTAFHWTLPESAATYGLPYEWTERFALRRFGFHGLSVAYAVQRTERILGHLPQRLVVCHLGSGCSVTAVEAGRSVDTTMGFTPLDGVLMSTRSGAVDPGLLLHLQQQCGVGLDELHDALAHRAGLLGISGVSGDLRQVLAAADNGSARARLAYDCFVHALRRAVGAMVGVLGGIDALVFTGGIGENSPLVREEVSRALHGFGLRLDAEHNAAHPVDAVVSEGNSHPVALVIACREDLVIWNAVLEHCVARNGPHSVGL